MDLSYVTEVGGQTDENGKVIVDEVKKHLDFRYICPSEACWRILEQEMQAKSHHIERLEIHVEGGHVVNLDGCEELPTDENDPLYTLNSKLTAYFAYNRSKHPDERVLYRDIPRVCTWVCVKKDVSNRRKSMEICNLVRTFKRIAYWKEREVQHKPTIGRLYTVSPVQTDLWHLRILLNSVKAISWEDLRTHEGVEYDSFAEAALAKGLIQNDDEQMRAMREASLISTPKEMRFLFATLLVFQPPVHTAQLWADYQVEMAEDFIRAGFDESTSIRKVL